MYVVCMLYVCMLYVVWYVKFKGSLLVQAVQSWPLIGPRDTQMLRRICVGAYCSFCPRDTQMLRRICVGAYCSSTFYTLD